MKAIIVIHKLNEKVRECTLYDLRDMNDINERVYNALTRFGISEEMAIECASWAELSVDGDSFNEDDFDVYIEESDD